ncbi:MAG: hydroxymethylbilane synthase, partial [Fimbriimonadaceae bacterium]|nr:hydroxymethylbilane synthase [Chitinophagales bacterium]
MSKKIIIGTRGSDLALWQANFLLSELKRINVDAELKIIKTQGDKIQHLSLEKLEGKGFFTKEIEDALLANEIDIAVHSHKDLPTENTPGLTVAAVSEREDCSEILLIRKECVDELKEFDLKENAVIGTSSSRRNVQLKFFRPDITCKDIRGNVPTRINKLRNGDYDAVMLAYAGVHRLNLDISDLHVVKIEPHKLIPAPAQGVLAFQCRQYDEKIKEMLKQIHHADVFETISIEREVMRLFKGGCHMPLGVYCKKENNTFHIWSAQADDKDGMIRRLYATGENISAGEIFEKLKIRKNQSVFISRDIDTESKYYKVLNAAGFSVSGKSFLNFAEIQINELPVCDWLFFTSRNGGKYFFDQVKTIPQHIKIAAMGNETASEIHERGYKTGFTGDGDIKHTADLFSSIAKKSGVCFPQALHAKEELMNYLDKSIAVIKLPVYDNKIKLHEPVAQHDILVFTSP